MVHCRASAFGASHAWQGKATLPLMALSVKRYRFARSRTSAAPDPGGEKGRW